VENPVKIAGFLEEPNERKILINENNKRENPLYIRPLCSQLNNSVS